MLGFRYVCQEHQQLFIDTVAHEGCGDPEEMEKVRRRLLAWLSEKYPRLVLEKFNQEACIGCALEQAQVDAGPIFDAVREIVRGLGSEASRDDFAEAYLAQTPKPPTRRR